MAQTAQLMTQAMGLLRKLLLDSLTEGGNLETKAWEFRRWASGNKSINKYFKQKSACVCRSNNPELKSPCALCLKGTVRFLRAPRHGPDEESAHPSQGHLGDAAGMPGSNGIHCLLPWFCCWSTCSHAAPTQPHQDGFSSGTEMILCIPPSQTGQLSSLIADVQPLPKTQVFASASPQSSKKQSHWQASVTCETLLMGRKVPEQDQP